MERQIKGCASKIRVHVKIRNHLEVSVQNSFVLITKYERYFGYLPIIKLQKLRFDMECDFFASSVWFRFGSVTGNSGSATCKLLHGNTAQSALQSVLP